MSLFDYAFARQNGGRFVLRIEDTDRARYNPESEQRVYDALHWLGLAWDEGPDIGGPHSPYRQSERLPIYQQHARRLVEQGQAYYCFCTADRLTEMRKAQEAAHQPPKYDRLCFALSATEVRDRLEAGVAHVVRMKMPRGGTTVVEDLARGAIEFENDLQDDAVILKSDGFPTYHLAVVVDDHLMEITHVVRGEEWISSAPKHVVLYNALGWEVPAFVHMPLMRNADKSKISKRKNHTSLEWYRSQGFLPQALLNYLALQGWSMPDGREYFSLDEFIANFTWDRISLGGPIFDIKRLDDLNGLYIRSLSESSFLAAIAPWAPSDVDPRLLSSLAPLVQTRMNRLSELPALAGFFFHGPDYSGTIRQMLAEPKWGGQKLYALLQQANPELPALGPAPADEAVREAIDASSTGATRALRALLLDVKLGIEGSVALLERSYHVLQHAPAWDAPTIEAQFRAFCDAEGLKLRQPTDLVRVAVTGSKAGPPLFESMVVLGRDQCLFRIAAALERVGSSAVG